MTGKAPTEEQLIQYIAQTFNTDHINVPVREVISTLKIGRGIQLDATEKPITNPYAVGHFKCFNYIFQNLVASSDFPCKDLRILVNKYHSDTSLYWLREIHSLITYPVAQFGVTNGDYNAPKTYECGVYRCTERQLAFSKAPEPEHIPQLLHLWLLDIAAFHDAIKGKIHNPYGLTRDEAEQLYFKPMETQLFISCLQPFEDGNNRVARLVENALRLHWGLPWKQPNSEVNYIERLGEYQMKEFPKWMKKLKDS